MFANMPRLPLFVYSSCAAGARIRKNGVPLCCGKRCSLTPPRSDFLRPFSMHGVWSKKVSLFVMNGSGEKNTSNENGSSSELSPEDDSWLNGLESLFEEAMMSYYEGAPLFTESEFQTLRDELEYLGASHVRLRAMEKVWMAASQERDFDRRVRRELALSEDDMNHLKTRLITANKKRQMNEEDKKDEQGKSSTSMDVFSPRSARAFGISDAEILDANHRVDERLRWLLFGDAQEERLKIVLLYLPAVLMSFITATFFTILFALLDGEMHIYVTSAGRVRLGIMTYVVVALTVWFSNKVTPATLEFLDLGKPLLMRGKCPNCNGPVSCLFTGGARVRDERKCRVCGAMVGFNHKWRKVYMVSAPGTRKYSKPD